MTTFNDSPQAALGFLISQTSHIESQVYAVKYPDITYQDLIPIDTSANQWATTVEYYSMDGAGRANWINGAARDVPMVDTSREKHSTEVQMAAIGYQYNIQEINQARMLGQNLSADRAMYARRAYEELVESVAFDGDTAKGFEGLFGNSSVTVVAAPNNAGATSTLWTAKTPDEILLDVNTLLSGIYTASKTIEMADTLLLPEERYIHIGTRRLSDTSEMTILEWIKRSNVYTMKTGQPLNIRGQRQLITKGGSSSARAVAYRKSPEVLKMHIPMPLQFLAPQQQVFNFIVPGMFRVGGVDIRLPGAVRYQDGI